MGELFFGVDVAGVINENISPGLPTTATIRKRVPGVRTPGALTGGTNPTELSATAKCVVGRYSAHLIDGTRIKEDDRRVTLIAESMVFATTAFVPESDTLIDVEGKTYNVLSVGRDPAGATYSCHCRA